MNLQQIRWPVVLLTLAAALGGLFGAGFLLRSRTVDQPLSQALAALPQVESYSVAQVGEKYEITVRLTPSADLKAAYTALDGAVRQIVKGIPFGIEVEDRRSPELDQAADRLDLYLHEALVTGQFATMADRIEAEARKIDAEARVGIDGHHLYVTLRKGDAYLYRVVERPNLRAEPAAEGGDGL